MICVVPIPHGTPAYDAACHLRDEVLRRPLGLELSLVETHKEAAYSHFGLYDEDVLVACLMVVPRGEGRVQLRQMAVVPDRRGQGLGSQLIREVENRLRAEGIAHMYLHAREPVIGFYRHLGYTETGERFEEIGITHQRMDKELLV